MPEKKSMHIVLKSLPSLQPSLLRIYYSEYVAACATIQLRKERQVINISPTKIPPFEQLVFLTEARVYHRNPPDEGKEIAFSGRSNVGKSSLINAITRNRKMAITSRLPGRTRGMVFFGWPNTNLRLVDLPGYGFARTSAQTREQWHHEINHYMHKRQSLVALLLLIDCRRQPQETEIELAQWSRDNNLGLLVCLTKVDKISASQKHKVIGTIRGQLNVDKGDICLCSVKKPDSIAVIRERIAQFL